MEAEKETEEWEEKQEDLWAEEESVHGTAGDLDKGSSSCVEGVEAGRSGQKRGWRGESGDSVSRQLYQEAGL